MNDKINFKLVMNGIVCSFALLLFALSFHAYAQAPEAMDVLNSLTGSNINSTTEIISSVPNVTATKFEILSPRNIGVDLKYSGDGKSPPIKVEAMAITTNSKLEDVVNQIGLLDVNSTTSNSSDSMTSMVSKLYQLGDILSSSNGTKSLDAGWKSPSGVTVKLGGNMSLNDAGFIGVVVR